MSYKWGLNRGGDGCLKKAFGKHVHTTNNASSDIIELHFFQWILRHLETFISLRHQVKHYANI